MKRNNGFVATVVMFVIMILLFIILYSMNNVKIHINEPVVFIEYGEDFHDDNVKATVFGIDVSNYLRKEELFNSHKKGKGFIRYTCFNQSEYRIIEVIDTKAPELFLIGEDVVSVTDDISNYEEPGFFAYDEVDGNISHRVGSVVLEKSDDEVEIEYSVCDYSGNWAEAYRTVNVIHEEESYFYDGIDDTEETQEQFSDGSDVVEVTEQVSNVYEHEVSENSLKKEIYLTFDDGPSELTPQYLDVLEEYGVNATFFVVGFEYEEDKEWKIPIMRRALDEGNAIALHGNSHEYSEIYQSPQTAAENFYSEHEVLQTVLGIDTKIVRFPGGASNTVSKQYCEGVMTAVTTEIVNAGYTYFDWNVDSNDAGSDIENSEAIYQNVIDGVRTGVSNVILMHDCGGHEATLETLSQIIETLQSEGYEFKTITSETEPVRHTVFN